jgi:ADP-ribosylglycohydrolase
MDILFQAYIGAKVADATAMPVHWYYNTAVLDRDYPDLEGYRKPRGEHPDSILWRSQYVPFNADADILHDQALYWGRRGVHYHQFLEAGENTLNFKLADELYRFILLKGGYSTDEWLQHYISCMRTPRWHSDTYIEEAHRGFFENRAHGIPLRECGVADMHIGGLAQVPALVTALHTTGNYDVSTVLEHVAATHNHPDTLQAAEALANMLSFMGEGATLGEAVSRHATGWIGIRRLEGLSSKPDRVIIGSIFSPACYLPEAFTASLALAWKHQADFNAGIISNARCGGDNCHRGAVVGALLGAVNPISEEWLSGLSRTTGRKH